MKKIFIYLIILFLISGGFFIFLKESKYLVVPQAEKEPLKAEVSNISTPKQEQETSTQPESVLPDKFKLDVPFTSQEPRVFIAGSDKTKWWDDDHNNACEEAAIITVDSYIKGKKLTPEIANKEILAMLDFQEKNKNYGERNKDLEAKEVAQLAKDFYKDYKNSKIIYDISIEDIKKEIFKGNPVILPTAGRLLSGPLSLGMNPYYTCEPKCVAGDGGEGDGPLYHMLVAIGWDEETKEIITNDPGKRHGGGTILKPGFRFKYDVLLNALHEWNGGDVEHGRSVMIILSR